MIPRCMIPHLTLLESEAQFDVDHQDHRRSSKSSTVTLAICFNVIGLGWIAILPEQDIVSDRMRELSFGIASDTTDAGY
jgi:hypothetical protein